MTHHDQEITGRLNRRKVALGMALFIGLAACQSLIQRQGWNPDHGPVVPHDSFPGDCSLCHLSGNWHSIKSDFLFDHGHETGTELRGAHVRVPCLMCHNDRGEVAAFAAQGCAGCHEDIHRGKLGRTCTLCHSEESWLPRGAITQHNKTRFPLVGAHAAVACNRCHPGSSSGSFEGLDPSCVSCHAADAASVVSPNHAQQGWTSDCAQCHQQTGWKPAAISHPPSFPLAGQHGAVSCSACHVGNTFTGLSPDCAGCHMTDFQQTTMPNHQQSGFSTNCTQCHTIFGWGGGNFNHSANFPLTGGHGGVVCAACHTGGVFTNLPTDCVNCHQSDFQNTTNPNHQQSGFSTNCLQCHTTNGWQGATFNHSANFPLSGGHGGLVCASCHSGGVFTGLSTNCVSCHQSDFNGTTNPNHQQSGFSTNCLQCHNTNAWQGATFNHSANFPLSGGHGGLVCASCHSGGVFTGLTTDCVSCHQSDFNGTTNPNHQQSGFSTNCLQCHNTNGWQGATFNHPNSFPLTGGHGGLVCASCHSGGVFTGLSTSCVSCHQSDFNGTTNPNHQQSGFSTNCLQCHNTNTWQGATFNHSFPRTGPHQRDCNECHLNPSNPSEFSCTHCHAHRQSAMDNKHSGVGGYVWLSSACLNCHPQGRE